MLMGSMFLLPVFTQEMLHYSATQSGIVLLPRTLAMMVASPFVGKLYNQTQPACLVGVRHAADRARLLDAGRHHARRPRRAICSGRSRSPASAFAFLFVPLTTAALSNVPRATARRRRRRQQLRAPDRRLDRPLDLRDAVHAATARRRRAALAIDVTVLRPEVAAQLRRRRS